MFHSLFQKISALTHPPSIEIVLNAALEKDTVYRFMKPWLGDGLVSGPGII